MSEHDNNEITKAKVGMVAGTRSGRYIWGAVFAILTILGFAFPAFSTSNLGFFWTIAWWATLILTFSPDLSVKALGFSKEFLKAAASSLPALGMFLARLLGALVIVAIGYFAFQWIAGDVNIGSTPLAQLTLNDLAHVGFAVIVFIGILKLAVRILAGEK